MAGAGFLVELQLKGDNYAQTAQRINIYSPERQDLRSLEADFSGRGAEPGVRGFASAAGGEDVMGKVELVRLPRFC